MRLDNIKTQKNDVLVIGGGGAGLRAAISARERGLSVGLVSKTRIGYGNNTIISAGIFAASGWGDSEDTYQAHFEDTLQGGRQINDRDLALNMVKNAPKQVSFLEKLHPNFNKKNGHLDLFFPPGHSYARHINFIPQSGRELILPLKAYAEKIGVTFHNQAFITRLCQSNNGIIGAFGIDETGQFTVFSAKSLILATGGFGQVYRQTNNATSLTGDGHELAWNAGVALRDMEMVQFYPTSTGKMGRKILLYEPVVIAMGAVIRNAAGENILEKHGMMSPDTMTRDKVCRAIYREIQSHQGIEHGVVLDLRPVENKGKLKKFLPASWNENQDELIITPTTHFCMGGIEVDRDLRTSVPGLFAAGEICAGVHGANRLAGNALAEVLSLGDLAGQAASDFAQQTESQIVEEGTIEAERKRLQSKIKATGNDIGQLRDQLKATMWENVGIIRSKPSLEKALETITELETDIVAIRCETPSQIIRHLELENMLFLARVICQSALLRSESRGAHFREDYPDETDQDWLCNIQVSRQSSGDATFSRIPAG